MKDYFFFIITCFFFLTTESQNSDQVQSKIDSAKVIGLSNPSKTTSLIKDAKRLVTDKNSPSYYEILVFEINFHSMSGNSDIVMNLADSLIQQNSSQDYKAEGYIQKGIIYARKSNMDKALVYLKKALPIAKKNQDYSRLSKIFKVMGNLSMTNGNGWEAIAQYKDAASFSIKDMDHYATGLVYNNLTRAFESVDQIDSAMYYNKKILKIVNSISDNGELYFTANLNEADFQTQTGNYKIAEDHMSNAFKVARRLNNPFMIAACHQVYSTLLKNKTNYTKAIEEAEKALAIYDEVGDKSNALLTLFLLKDYHALAGNYEDAYHTFERFKKEEDSLKILESDKNLKELRVQYETAEQKLKIAQQNADLYKKEQQQQIFLIIISALVLLSIIGYLYYKQRQKAQEQRISNLQNEKENVALKSLMAGEEKERSRIAKELHDGLGSILAAAKMHAGNKENLDKIVGLIDKASEASRRISHNLLPESLLKKGLDVTLQDYTNSLNESGLITVSYQSNGLKSVLPQSLQLSIYRIIQELLNNTIKHADATEAMIQLQERNSQLLITVEDNGRGFKLDDSSKGIGLSNIESRLSILKGKLKIDSDKKLGTSVYIELKLDN